MNTADIAPTLALLFGEIADGASPRGAFMLNSGDIGLLRSLDLLSAAEASQSSEEGATIAAHAAHLQYGLSLMNRWAREGGNPFADATWDVAWRTSRVDDAAWNGIREGLRAEATQWREALAAPRDVEPVALAGMIGSIAHFAYHVGAIRQITKRGRGPKEATVSGL